MNRVLLALAVSTLMFEGMANANPLNETAIRTSLSDATLTGINQFNSPFIYHYKPNGTLRGISGKLKQFDDRGRWSVEQSKLCVHWELWAGGEKNCYSIIREGNEFKQLKEDGTVYLKSMFYKGEVGQVGTTTIADDK